MNRKKLICLVLACVLLFCACGNSVEPTERDVPSATSPKEEAAEPETGRTDYTLECEGFDSPEDAVLAYLDAMREGDVNGMISTFAIETLVDNLDIAEYHERAASFNMNSSYPIRADDAYTRAILLLRRQTELNNQLMRQYFYFNADNEAFFDGAPIPFTEHKEISDYATANQLFNDLMHPDWMDTLADMTYGRKALTEDRLDSFLLDNFGRSIASLEASIQAYTSGSHKAVYGYDDYSSVAIEVRLDGNNYCLFMDVACYDGKWYNFQQGGMLASITGCSTFEFGLVLIGD